MAVHRKRPVPRMTVSGKLSRRLLFALGLVLAALGSSPHARAQDSGGLSAGAASFEAGKYDQAVRQINNAINGESLAPAEAAKALYYRGLAYQKLNQPARAIADLGAAIWLGLSGSDRATAIATRGLAYRAAGLGNQAEEDFSTARKDGSGNMLERLMGGSSSSSEQTAEASSPPAASREGAAQQGLGATPPNAGPPKATVAEAQTSQTQSNDATDPGAWSTTSSDESSEGGSRLSRWWGSVRGQSRSESAPAPPEGQAESLQPLSQESTRTARADVEPAPSRAPAASGAEPQPMTPSPPPEAAPEPSSGGSRLSRWWGSVREGVGGIGRSEEGSGEAPPATGEASAQAAGAAVGGGYRLQLTPTRSEAEAQQLWQNVSAKNPNLASASHRIEPTQMGDLGTFYRLQIGPFQDKAEGTKLCNALKRSGVDCFLVAP
jgi:tetratricopeptide (TPR) repeat protein